MSVATIINPATGKITSTYLPGISVGSIATPILQSGGAVPAPLTGSFTCLESGNYILQMFIVCSGAGANVGAGANYCSYNTSDGWGDLNVSSSSMVIGIPFVQTTIGQIMAGVNTFTFAPSTGLNLGATGEIAVRIVKALTE